MGRRLSTTPNFLSFGEDTFSYTIDDGTGLTSTGMVRVNVPDLLADSYFAGSI